MAIEIRDTIKRVWIAPGCIVCHACEEHCPEVFYVEELSGSIVAADVDPNDFAHGIEIAASICPVEVIKIDPLLPEERPTSP